jgi:hypothetical protein
MLPSGLRQHAELDIEGPIVDLLRFRHQTQGFQTPRLFQHLKTSANAAFLVSIATSDIQQDRFCNGPETFRTFPDKFLDGQQFPDLQTYSLRGTLILKISTQMQPISRYSYLRFPSGNLILLINVREVLKSYSVCYLRHLQGSCQSRFPECPTVSSDIFPKDRLKSQ